MIPWRSNQGRRLDESESSSKSGSDSTGGTTWAKSGGRTELDHSTSGLARAQRAFKKAEAYGAARPTPNSVQLAQNPCASPKLWREPSGAHEAAGLSAGAGSAQAEARLAVVAPPLGFPLAGRRNELTSDP